MDRGPILSRRSFLSLAGAAIAAKVVIPAFTPPRAPYVVVGEPVAYIGLARRPAPTFIGSTIVRAIEDWDGVGYPCTLACQSFYRDAIMPARFYDSDLSNFLRELPDRFWWDAGRRNKYPNVHAFVREQRYGEDPEVYCRQFGLRVAAAGWEA